MVGSGLAALTAMATTPAAAAERSGPARALSRAVAAYSALERHFDTNDGSGLVREQVPAAADDKPYSYEWPFSGLPAGVAQSSTANGGAVIQWNDVSVNDQLWQIVRVN